MVVLAWYSVWMKMVKNHGGLYAYDDTQWYKLSVSTKTKLKEHAFSRVNLEHH